MPAGAARLGANPTTDGLLGVTAQDQTPGVRIVVEPDGVTGGQAKLNKIRGELVELHRNTGQRTAPGRAAPPSPANRLGPMRRPSKRTALSLRYAQHWSIRQPRTLASLNDAAAQQPAPARAAAPTAATRAAPKPPAAEPEPVTPPAAIVTGAVASASAPTFPGLQSASAAAAPPRTPPAVLDRVKRVSAALPEAGDGSPLNPEQILQRLRQCVVLRPRSRRP